MSHNLLPATQETIQEASPARTAPFSLKASQRRIIKMLLGFTARRLAFGALVLLVIMYLTFVALLGLQGAPLSAALSQAVLQTGAYLAGLAHADLGVTAAGSLAFRTLPIGEVLPDIVLRSLGLLGAAFLLAIGIGVPLGAWAALRRHNRFSILLILTSIVGVSTPSFFAALFLQIAAIQYTRTFGSSIVPVGGFGWDKHIILPMLVLAARPVAQITRITYVALCEVFDQDYVRTAHSKGLRSEQVFTAHVIKNAAVPILTTIIISLRFSLSSLPIVEIYFGWGGLGQSLLVALFNGDAQFSTALLLSLGLLFILTNIILEIGYYLIDPRLRQGSSSTKHGENTNLIGVIQGLLSELGALLFDNPISKSVRQLFSRARPEISPFTSLISDQIEAEKGENPPGEDAWRAWQRGLLGNLPLGLGTAIVFGLVFLVLFGPRLAPYSPNTTQLVAYIDGVLTTPPFPPGELHLLGTDPLGRDMLSLILAGAQQTIILAFIVVLARMLIGILMGVLAGWFSDSWLDRAIQAFTQALMVYPTLLIAALLIFIIGIQNGIRTFILALSLVGWVEIMQFVRGEVINIRPRPFIESAVAVGQRTSRLILMHVLPNLAPMLVSLAALEMGAVLLVLGELGFLGIFISGGAGSDFGLYSQVPEWGALLSGVRTWTRAYPWTGFYPTLAFFVAVLGFNLLGEGIRRMVTEIGMVMKGLVNRYTIAAAAALLVGFVWARGNTGELAFFRQQAEAFDGEKAQQHIQALTEEHLQGRALDTDGLKAAGDYIATQFSHLGLQAGGENMGYLQSESRSYLALTGQPELRFDADLQPRYRYDFAVYPSARSVIGEAQGPVRVLAGGTQADYSSRQAAEEIILLLSEDELPRLGSFRCRAVLIVAAQQADIKRRYTFSAAHSGSGCGQDTPVMWISAQFASRVFASAGESLNSVTELSQELAPQDIIDLPLGITAYMQVQGRVQNNAAAVNVIGQLPGSSADLDNKLIIIAAQFDSPPVGQEGVFPGANDNASGVAVMLEAVRSMQESGYQPFKTFLFVAYSGEGFPDLRDSPQVQRFLQARSTFEDAFDIEAVIYLRGLGISNENKLGIWSLNQSEAAKLVESAIHLSGMETERIQRLPSMNIFTAGGESAQADAQYPQIGISRLGWERTARLSNDTLTFISTSELEASGEALTLSLMILGRERLP